MKRNRDRDQRRRNERRQRSEREREDGTAAPPTPRPARVDRGSPSSSSPPSIPASDADGSDGPTRADASGPISVREKAGHLVPDREPARPAPSHSFTVDGEEWIARRLGVGRGGSGSIAAARLAAIRFARADEPEKAVREALVPIGRFDAYYDDEWREIFERASRIERRDDEGR